MLKAIIKYNLIFSASVLAGCRERFEPSVTQANLNYLVVDGFLNNSTDSTFIRLSRTTDVSGGYYVDKKGEFNAQMTVEDETGNTLYTFIAVNKNGLYALPGMHLDENKKYHLRINTTDGNRYISDDITAKKNPPIDSVSWDRTNTGVKIYVNTHDPENNTNYYRWEYSETWEYYSHFYSKVKYAGPPDSIMIRDSDEMVNHCWQTRNSNGILLANSLKLSQDIISRMPVRFIPINSFEISSTYSILVNQYSVSKKAFDYYEALKKNTEQFGSLFDAQPLILYGNMHCLTKPGSPVIGYLTATTLQSKRIYIANSEVAPWNEGLICPDPQIVSKDSFTYSLRLDTLPGFLKLTPLEAIYGSHGEIIGVKAGYRACSDCISRGGINVKPHFWP